MNRSMALLSAGILWAISGCAVEQTAYPGLNGVLWIQTSAEYQVAAHQAFNLAKENIENALVDPHWTAALEQQDQEGYQDLKPAIILDVDETVLDNSPFMARLIKNSIAYNRTLWQAWVNESSADAIPGAKSLIRYARAKGIKIFYVTNRILEAPTVNNIKMVLDPAVTPAEVLCKNEKETWDADKTSRRQFIASHYRILLLMGDDYNDFAYLGKVSPQQRIAKARAHQSYWGKQWVLMSNPVYGHWKRALFNTDKTLSVADKLKLKIKALNEH